MRIREFSSTLSFAITDLNDEKKESNKGFESNFDKIMSKFTKYIQRVVGDKNEKEIEEKTFEDIILDDYESMINQTFKNTSIYFCSMKYIALKYLNDHREEIPELLEEINKRNLKVKDGESYTDNFHENLLQALITMGNEYKNYCESMGEINGEFSKEMEAYEKEFGKEEGLKKYCEKYSNMKSVPFQSKRTLLTYAYNTFLGMQGVDEKNTSQEIVNYKKNYNIKDYITTYLAGTEEIYREELKKSILSMISQLDNLGEIDYSIDIHNNRMDRIKLPGLKYFSKESNPDKKAAKVEELLSSTNLDKLDLDVLLRMNSFYNNRFAKIIEEYSKVLFVLINTNTLDLAVEGKTLTKNSFHKDMISNLMLKYQTLLLPIKSYYNEIQKEINEHPNLNSSKIQQVKLKDRELPSSQIVLRLDKYLEDVKRVWKKEYQKYFDARLPYNDLEQDMCLCNLLYNPIYLSYKFKNLAIKAEYGYMHYLSQEDPSRSLNFGVILRENKKINNKEKKIEIASDGGLNLANRLHTLRRGFSDFVISYTGKPLARIYEGFEDFIVGEEYVSTQLLLPFAKQHEKYLKDFKRDRIEKKNDTVSKITPMNEKFVEHLMYCMNRRNFMKSHRVTIERKDKKGNSVFSDEQVVRYVDLNNGEIYTLKKDGSLVNSNGTIFGENSESVR